ncbi:OsmC family protein [Flavobacterium cauense R2A-7]|uniref:Osmotically inducible protein OsmC n=1 Tax=Flavobacterium cauense R2A-7 TaxID=1341154 RepID=V6RYD7_9FLAO|nr:OsmC family protein [Flavobacterium cauense]ESU19047.1 OsmC family protein [Flavobacterium cauense R2A-7]KGO82325.1 peroxiredoxin [Flavobacterium cauense R2A-7]TWI15289.1 osmotically inducible protein OsmC [Flavobacterium cauense R2A-7]
MKFNRRASAHWMGSGMEGKGTLTTQSTTLNNTQYSFKSRFEEGVGTNPEELIAAAHSGCFAMKLSFLLGDAGFTPDDLNVEAKVTFEDGAITESHLDLKAKIPGITNEAFQKIAAEAKATCPISKSITAAISLTAILV